jgi:hypothetical protein
VWRLESVLMERLAVRMLGRQAMGVLLSTLSFGRQPCGRPADGPNLCW